MEYVTIIANDLTQNVTVQIAEEVAPQITISVIEGAASDHLALTNIGVKTHTQIDTDLTTLQGEQITQNLAIALNTAKVSDINHVTLELPNVDNTSDVNKPVSTAQQTALNLKVNNSLLGAINGVAQLDASGFVKNTQLPSYVDDVLEYANLASFPVTGETGKIYVAIDTNKIYRWTGTVYIFITSGAVDSVSGKTGVVTLVKADVGLGGVDNTSDVAKPVSTAQQTALDLKVDKVTGYVLTKNDFTDILKAKLDSITEIFTTALKTSYDSAVTWISTNGTNLINHLSNVSNPHSVTKAQVGLGSVPNTDFTTAVGLNTAKVTNATHTNEVTGSESLTITNGVITRAKLAAEQKSRIVLSTANIDWGLGKEFTKTLAANWIITESNLPTGTDTDCIVVYVTGAFTITPPAYWKKHGTGAYDGAKINMYVIDCLNGTVASEDVKYAIIPAV